MKTKVYYSLKTFILLGLILSIIIPLFLAKFYIENENKKKLYESFAQERENLTANIAKAMQEPLKTFSPSEASSALEVIKQDCKIAKILIFDATTEATFITIDIPNRYNGTLYKNFQKIYSEEKEYLGSIEIIFNDVHIQAELNALNETIKIIFAFTFIFLVVVMETFLHFKVFSPLKILLNQAQNFQDNNLENGYTWKGHDELSIVGNSFELARTSTLNLLKQLSKKNEELEKLYITDKLTNVYNRYKLDMVLNDLENYSTRYNQTFGIILLDIDDFKSVNDTYGHLAGDKVLIDIALILKNNIRKTDILGRWGGEEFLIIVPQSNKEDLLELSKKLKDFIAEHDFKLPRQVTASFGLSLYEKNLNTLFKNADDALYKVKNSGKNNIYFLI